MEKIANFEGGLLEVDDLTLDQLRLAATHAGSTSPLLALHFLRKGLSSWREFLLPNVGTSSRDLMDEGYRYVDQIRIYDAEPGEVETVELLKAPDGSFLKAWSVLEEFDGNTWAPVPFGTEGTFAEKRLHHFSEPVSYEEALRLVREYLIPTEFQAEFSCVNQQAASPAPTIEIKITMPAIGR